jgi:20S proteasome subunit beta 1
MASFIVAGVDPYEGPQVYRIPSGGSSFREKFAIAGSGSTFIFGYCDTQFKENMSLEEAKKFAINGKNIQYHPF